MARTRRIWITAVIAAAAAITGGGVYALAGAHGSTTAATVPAIGRVLPAAQRPAAPRITGPAVTGTPLDTSKIDGVVVVNIWGSWCVPCRAEAPILRQVALDTKPLGVRFLGVDIKDNRRRRDHEHHLQEASTVRVTVAPRLAPVDRPRSKKGPGVTSETLSHLQKPGGRYWDRTSDFLGVNEALSR
jgi:thiol-disulfide isomerase/thioredoxin